MLKPRNLMFGLACLLPLAAFAAPALAEEPFEFGQNFARSYIINSYDRLAAEAGLMQQTMTSLCAAPDAAGLDRARTQFGALVDAWSRIEFVRFGPILTDNRLERILFFPDPRGLGLRQVQAILSGEDETATSLESLRAKSVATQGLTSLEYVLFGDAGDTLTTANGDFACRYAKTIAAAIVATAGEVLADWEAPDSLASELEDPEDDNADFRSPREVLNEFIGVMVHGLENIRDARLSMLVSETGDVNPRIALFYRSGLTMRALTADVAGLRTMLLTSGIESLMPEDQRWEVGSVDFEMQNFLRTAGEIADLPLDQVARDDDGQGKVRYLVIVTNSLQRLVVEQLAAELGLAAGFSALDGD
ncbi:MAG: hypothetical protein H6873_06115 [Hyphomicrobiaceae bacterium]|nr:hypothetical protein [Hyphomicrobiaceae bacterium]